MENFRGILVLMAVLKIATFLRRGPKTFSEDSAIFCSATDADTANNAGKAAEKQYACEDRR
jgi:hypothetical protein